MVKKIMFLVAPFCFSAVRQDNAKLRLSHPEKLIDIGGYKLHINGTGNSSNTGPTVILDSCMGGSFVCWALVQPEVAKFVRVCSYDRAGLGWSDESPYQRSSKYMVEELHKLLENSGERGPYILVGHSSGGINMRLYANMYPEQVYGVILVDASHEDQLEVFKEIDARVPVEVWQTAKNWFVSTRFCVVCAHVLETCHIISPNVNTMVPAGQRELIKFLESSPKAQKTGGAEEANFATSMQQLKDSANRLEDKPLIVITARRNWDEYYPQFGSARMREYQQVWSDFQKDFLTKSCKSKQIFAEKSGHFVVWDQPEVIVDAIRLMVEQYQKDQLGS